MLRLILLFCLMVVNGSVSGQGISHISIGAGLQTGAFRDQMYSPLNYDKTGFSTLINYNYQIKRSNIDIDLKYAQAKLKTPASNYFESIYYGAALEATYLYSALKENGGALKLYIGAGYALRGDFATRDWENYTYIVTNSFEPVIKIQWNIAPKHILDTRAAAFVMGFVLRPPYNRVPEDYNELNQSLFEHILIEFSKSKFNMIGKYIDINWTTNYQFQIIKNLNIGLTYELRFQKYNEVQPISQFDNNIMLKINIRL